MIRAWAGIVAAVVNAVAGVMLAACAWHFLHSREEFVRQRVETEMRKEGHRICSECVSAFARQHGLEIMGLGAK